jgi:hypothetical protein
MKKSWKEILKDHCASDRHKHSKSNKILVFKDTSSKLSQEQIDAASHAIDKFLMDKQKG